jgi:hypothetical protein
VISRTRAALLILVTALLVLGHGPARAAGTGGVDVSPYPGVQNGKQITAFHAKVPSRGSSTVQYALRNTTSKTATARLFGASARKTDGTFTLGPAESSPYLDFADRTVTLKPHETRIASFRVHPGPDGRPKGTAYAALVVEVKNGSVIQQAATVVYLQPGRTVPLPLLVVLVAVALVLLGRAGLVLVRRRRRPTP